MTRPPEATPAFLSEHYVYEISLLRATHALLCQMPESVITNALIESFAVHARALMDFFTGQTSRDDSAAAHFTVDGKFAGHGAAKLARTLRERFNKQVTHLTYARAGALKIGLRDRLLLLEAIEADHAAFKIEVAPEFRGCFNGEGAFETQLPRVVLQLAFSK